MYRPYMTLISRPIGICYILHVYCLCRDVGVKAIESLMQKKGKFDYILLETTGLADPGPIAAMFWLDDELGSEIYLDGKLVVSLLQILQSPCLAMYTPWVRHFLSIFVLQYMVLCGID